MIMSGHSKWSKVKHQKESTDAQKGKIFTKMTNAIIMAVKQGGGNHDPETNFKLRLAIERAKNFNLPKENIQRALDRAKKGTEQSELTEIIYEAIGPKGIGIIIRVATDNKQRTVAEIKNILERGGGVLANTGAVSYLFENVGLIEVIKNGQESDELLKLIMDADALDLEEEENQFIIYTPPASLHKTRELLESHKFKVTTSELFFRPKEKIILTDKDENQRVIRLLNTLEELEDVQRVYANIG